MCVCESAPSECSSIFYNQNETTHTHTHTHTHRRLALDLAVRLIGVGPEPGRVVVGRLLRLLQTCTEEAVAQVMAAAGGGGSTDDAARCWQRLEGLLAVLHELVAEGGPLGTCGRAEKKYDHVLAVFVGSPVT